MKTKHIIELLLTFVIGYLMYRIMRPFFVPVFWGAICVILFHPYYLWLKKRLKNETAASALACMSIAFFLIVPLAAIGTALANEMLGLYQWAENYVKGLSDTRSGTTEFLSYYIQRYLSPYADISAGEIQEHILNAIKQGSRFLAYGIEGAIRNFAEFVFNTFVAFFAMFFLFRDSGRVLRFVKDIIPLPEKDTEDVLARSRVVISATFKGGVLIGATQGLLGGFAFWFLGLPSAVLWGFVMFILSFLPAVGTVLVWGPAAIYLFITGAYIKGSILVAWGVLIVGLADNILRPIIVSGKTHQHPLLLFFSIIGAVNAFGIIGIIAGPVVLSLAQAIMDIYRSSIRRSTQEEA